MNIEDLLRQDLHNQADAVSPIDDLLETSTTLGRRKQRGHRLVIGGSALAAAAVVVGGSLVVADAGSGHSAQVKIGPASGGPTQSAAPAPVWWQSWPQGRHFGPVDDQFLTNARPTYDTAKGPEKITVWATGSEPDGSDWVMFTDPADGHRLERLQGWNGQPDYGDGEDVADHATWFSWTAPTLDSHNDANSTSQFMIIVGKPGTTSISYAANGTDFTDLEVNDGIAVVRLPTFPPAAAVVKLSDADGVYATGAPEGAGAGADAGATTSPTPDSTELPAGTATATATSSPGAGS